MIDSAGWQKLWLKHYNNTSDQRWKTKSLNPLPTEHFPIPIPKIVKPVQDPQKDIGNKNPKEKQETQTQSNQEPLPSPKMNKINDTMFCISMERDLHLFYMITNAEEKAKQKQKKTFGVIHHTLTSPNERIEQVTGNNSSYIFVRTQNNLIVLEIIDSKNNGTKDGIQVKFSKSIPNLITFIASDDILLALSATHLHQFEIGNQIKEVLAKKIEFGSQTEEEQYRTLVPVGIVTGAERALYYFGSRVEYQIDVSKLKGQPGEETDQKVKSEALTIVKLSVGGEGKVGQVRAQVFPIDHIFQLGMFARSKIYEIQKQTFLVSLHEEVVMIKKNWGRYIVWDNVSVVSSKSQSKKGQLILADKNILVYSENTEIYAHEIYFSEADSKLKMPAIDNFKGNDEDEKVLYDALLLFDEDSIMKVLVYLRPNLVIYPTNAVNFKRRETDPAKLKDEPTQIQFSLICINQSDPKKKLEQLIEKGKTNQEIEQFRRRFNISKQDQTKSRWNVSKKELKDIEGILMDIQEDAFIQTELDNILKKSSHNLDFLCSVETKQLIRLNRLLVERICALTEMDERSPQADPQKEYIYKILQWYMESEMFLKKVTYSKNFLSFKEYDFIEIGKLKAASLKEEIKLLSSKRFEKRLKYFLNSFKILVIANYEEVFGFLLEKKSIDEIFQFINEFRFILPNFEEPSAVFIKQKDFNIFGDRKPAILDAPPPMKRDRAPSFSGDDGMFNKIAERIKEKEKEMEQLKEKKTEKTEKSQKAEKDEKCILWDPLEDVEKEGGKITQTLQYFEQKIIHELKTASKSQNGREKAIRIFKNLLQNFKSQPWFGNAAFKQHSMITKSTKEVHEQFKQLKRKGAFKILIKILYRKIAEDGGDTQQKINKMLQEFIKSKIIPKSFKRNVDARVLVYRNLLQNKNSKDGKRSIGFQLPLLEDFIVIPQQKYFDFLFRNIRDKILKEVKDIYDQIEPSFFQQRFQMYLQSQLIQPNDIIDFLDSFTQDVAADQIRIDVFSAIKRLLRLKDKDNTINYINKCMDREVLPEREDNQASKLREQAKIPYGFFFFNFFKAFNLDYSYEEFIYFTNTRIITENKVIQELITRYCKGQYRIQKDYYTQADCCLIKFQGEGIHEKMPDVDIHNQPLQFFGLILHLIYLLDFQVQQSQIFELLLQNYLCEGKFKELSDFIRKLKQYHVTENNLHTNNYKMISDFKEEIDVDHQFIDYVINWIKRNYAAIGSNDVEDRMRANQSALRMLSQFNKNSADVKQQKSLFELLSNIRSLDPSAVLQVQQLKKEAMTHSSFIFLMHRFNELGVQKIRQFIQKQKWLDALNCFSEMFLSHKQYAYQERVDDSHPDYIRFLIEVCIVMIEENLYPIAKYLITKRIPDDHYYFKDVLLLFLTAVKVDDHKLRDFRESVNKHILQPETTSLIRENLEDKILNVYRIADFIKIREEGVETGAKSSRKPSKILDCQDKFLRSVKTEKFKNRAKDMFDLILSRHRKDDAYFYLVRVKRLNNSAIQAIATKTRTYNLGEQSEQDRMKVQLCSYLLVTSYMKILELFIQKEFYPTFVFFQSKMLILSEKQERMDMIKDINIALSKLDRLDLTKFQNPQLKKHLMDLRNQLETAYKAYMQAIGEDPDIKLAVGQTKGLAATKKVEMYSRKSNKDLFFEQNREEVEYKKELQRNMEMVNKVQENSKVNVLSKEISAKLTEVQKANERHSNLEAEMRKEEPQESLTVRREKALEKIRAEEKEEIESIKETYKSNTTKRVNELIQNLRRNREKAAEKRNAPTSAIRDQPRESLIGTSKPPNIVIMQSPSIRRPENMVSPQSPKYQLVPDNLLPITMKNKIEKINNIREEVRATSGEATNRMQQLQRRMLSEPAHDVPIRKKANFDDIAKLYKEKESEEAYKCIQKYDMLKNPQVRTQLIKRAYIVTKNLENFLEFLKFLLALDETWKQSIEEKSINVAVQMLKMHKQEKITVKEIIPGEFFTTVVKLSPKDYATHIFELFKPSIKKIFEKELMAANALAIMFRYALGDNRFYNKTFHEYFKVILKNYEIKNVDDKELTLLAERIRSNYHYLPDNKDQILQELLNSISNPLKKSRLLQALKRTIERQGESFTPGTVVKEIAYVVQKLMK